MHNQTTRPQSTSRTWRWRKGLALTLLSAALSVGSLGAVTWPAQADSVTIDTSSESAVRSAFLNNFVPQMDVAANWTGSVSGCNPGTTSSSHRNASITTINYFRALAGLPSVTEYATGTNHAQQAAVSMYAKQDIEHVLPTDWPCYTAAAASSADNANLSLGYTTAPAGIEGMISDATTGNDKVGHRNWLFYPKLSGVGIGVAFTGTPSDKNLGVQVVSIYTPEAQLDNPASSKGIGWPSAGYFPYENLPGNDLTQNDIVRRWSYAQSGVDFTGKTVTVTRNGQAISGISVLYRDKANVINPRISWSMPNYTAPSAGGTGSVDEYVVTISGLPSYTVKVIRAARLTVDKATISPTTATVGTTLTATATTTPAKGADQVTYQWKRAGVAISGATAKTYKLVDADAGKAITVTVTPKASATLTYTARKFTFVGYGSATSTTVTPPVPAVVATGVTMSPTSGTVEIGKTATVTATISPSNVADKTLTWTSSNMSVATVSTATTTANPATATITGKAAGSATITAKTANGKTASYSVTVKAATVAVWSISLSPNILNLDKGKTATLTATVYPLTATDKTVNWTSSNQAVATVGPSKTTTSPGAVTVTAVGGGSARITATTPNGTSTWITVTVAVPATAVTFTCTPASWADANCTYGTVAANGNGAGLGLVATITPSDVTNTVLTWTSSNPNVAVPSSTWSPNNSAGVVIYGVGPGTATITATTSNGKKDTFTVTVPAVDATFYWDTNTSSDRIAYVGNQTTNMSSKWDNQASMLTVSGAKKQVRVYQGANASGIYQAFPYGTYSLWPWFNDQTTSFRILDDPTVNGAVFYDDINGDLSANPQTITKTAATNEPAVPSTWNDRVSYLYVPYCSTVTIYQDTNYLGANRTFTTGVYNLPDYVMAGSRSWNDAISSYKIAKDTSKTGC
ncbi:MAG: Ig-like domain-containing protein [Propionibacteriaceae bacterium]|jgi:uncharacterized protein YjdB|nr:Ig-like domain-containing protein [Propionibacteriaceae bacterium]